MCVLPRASRQGWRLARIFFAVDVSEHSTAFRKVFLVDLQ
jgi:hypothetical protein